MRKANWGPNQTMHLCTLVEEKVNIIKGKFDPRLTSADKKVALDAIRDGNKCPSRKEAVQVRLQ